MKPKTLIGQFFMMKKNNFYFSIQKIKFEVKDEFKEWARANMKKGFYFDNTENIFTFMDRDDALLSKTTWH